LGCFPADLRPMARWLMDQGVRSVARQSTGVYGMPGFAVLEPPGWQGYVGNARHTQNLPGRKSDVQECPGLRKLPAFGLRNNSFPPTHEIRIAGTLWRHSGNWVAAAGRAIPRRQKVWIEMHIQRAHVRSDLSGVSGMKIMGAILEGERDPGEWAAWVRPEVKATPEDMAKSLEGNWREERLFI
jgi:transposase